MVTTKEKRNDWQQEYAEHCLGKEKKYNEKEALGEQVKEKDACEDVGSSVEDWALQYHNYCVEKEAKIADSEKQADKDLEASIKESSENKGDSWEVQYAAYLMEKVILEQTKHEKKSN